MVPLQVLQHLSEILSQFEILTQSLQDLLQRKYKGLCENIRNFDPDFDSIDSEIKGRQNSFRNFYQMPSEFM